MERYRCPVCSGRIEIRSVFDDRELATCTKCLLTHVFRSERPGRDEAYLRLLEEYDLGRIDPHADRLRTLEEENLIRSEKMISELLARSGEALSSVPDPVKEALMSRSDYVVDYRLMAESNPSAGPQVEELPQIGKGLRDALGSMGVGRLYTFQARAIEKIVQGNDACVVAPTGSGKTEAFSVPVFQRISDQLGGAPFPRPSGGRIHALFIYPTKALIRDQLPKLRRLAEGVPLRVEIFDGDTPRPDRERIVDNPPEVILTNFDSLHHHMLHRTAFSRLLRTVKIVVVDEVHVYSGTFGAHINFILRRLERLAGRFQIAAASATLSNPEEFTKGLFGRSLEMVLEPSGRHGRTHFLMLFPTLRSHRSLIVDSVKSLAKSGYRTLCFSNSHLGAELNAYFARRSGVTMEVHRAGLPADLRKRTEEEFKKGLISAISATPTLELGLDIGAIDSVVSELVSMTRLVQRTGRAGRRGQESIVMVVMRGNDPISQYYRLRPEDYYSDLDHGYVDPQNPSMAEVQILAASLDRPLARGEFPEFGEVIGRLSSAGLLTERDGTLHPDYRAARAVLRRLDIRGGGDRVTIHLRGKRIGERSLPMALEELHPGAVYFMRGFRYRSAELKLVGGTGQATVEPLPSGYPYYTKPLLEEWPRIEGTLETKTVFGVEVRRVILEIEKKVVGYVNIEMGRENTRGEKVRLENPVSYTFRTKGLIFTAPRPEKTLAAYPEEKASVVAASGFHATEHVSIEGTNMLTGGSSSDMGGISMGSSGLIFIYDGSSGGNGASRLLFDRLDRGFGRAFRILNDCPCDSESGCPRCTYSYRCGNNNEYLHKKAAIEVLTRILSGERSRLDGGAEGERPLV